MNQKLLALYGLKWNPFSPEIPLEALLLTPRLENFCWRVENLVGQGGFALVTGEPGLGKSITLRLLVDKLRARGSSRSASSPARRPASMTSIANWEISSRSSSLPTTAGREPACCVNAGWPISKPPSCGRSW